MRNDNRKSSGGWSDNKRSSRPSMHKATCVKCNSKCEVPFKPNGRKPIYCSDCFEREDNKQSKPRPEFHGKQKDDNHEVVKQLKALNEKFDEMLDILSELVSGEVDNDMYEDEEELEDGESDDVEDEDQENE